MRRLIESTLSLCTIVILLTVPSASAQKRVFTNEDIATPAPASPAAVSEPATPQSVGDAQPAESAESKPPALPNTPQSDLKHSQGLQATLMDIYGDLTAKMDETADSTTRAKWDEMRSLVSSLMSLNQKFVDELKNKVPPAPSTAAPVKQ